MKPFFQPAAETKKFLSIFIASVIALFFIVGTCIAPSAGAQQSQKAPLSTVESAAETWQASAEQNTVFLPLKINAVGKGEEFTRQIDNIFNEILISKKQVPFARQKAAAVFDYTSWPPPFEQLAKFSNTLKTDYVMVGSLTMLGQKLSIDLAVYDIHEAGAPQLFYKEAENFNGLERILNELIGDVLAYSGKYYQIASVRVQGNSRIDSGAILRHVGSKPGDRYSPEQLSKDIKNIFKMGYFNDVQVSASDTVKGKEITFSVVEKDIIGQVSITNNKEVDEEDIRAVISVTQNSIISNQEIKKSISNIKRLYKEKGFYNTEVVANLSYPRKGRVKVDFDIKEGTKVFIKEVKILGNITFSEKKLKKVIETSERGLFSWITDSGVLKREIVEQDVARLAAFYHNNGFVDAKVGEPEIVQKGEWLYITFNVSEGDRYSVGSLTITGDLIEDENKLLGMTTLRSQDYFSRKILRDDIVTLSDYYAEKGYAFSEIVPYVEKNETAREAMVTLNIKKNELVSINRIIIKGNTRTRDKVIRREMKLKEGEIFDATALKQSLQRLQRLGFFEDVSVAPEQTEEEALMDIIVEVKEKPTGTFSIGAGYSSVDQFMFMGEISEDNFLGRGQKLSLQANLSGTSNRYNFQFTEPHLNDSDLSVGFDLYDWEREFDDFIKNSKGLAMRFGYPVWELWRANWSYGYDKTDLTINDSTSVAQQILDSLDIHVTSYVTLGFSRDTRNNLFNPTEGAVHAIESKYAGGVLGGDSYFTKVQGSSSWYFPFLFGTTLHLKATAGYVTENTGGKLPVYEKFYLGGINTIRGFKNGQISPRDPVTLDRIGGDKMWYINEEIIFPLVKDAGLNGVVFLDAGNVYSEDQHWDFSKIKRSVGVGLRWLSPLGPLRLEWGYNIKPVGDEEHDNWDFSIGGAF
jgi:outer membrane protein insertion porin family